MDESAKAWINRVVGLGVVGLVGYLTLQATPTGAPKVEGPRDAGASEVTSATTALGSSDAGAPASDAGLAAEVNLPLSFTLGEGDAGGLGATAPRSVRVGVVLVAWQGAEGAKPAALPRADALAKASRLAGLARTDWNGAVKEGDPESSLDIGRIPRRVLDARTEIAVFNLAPGEVSEPLETPRGYWIVKRIE